jgi:phosphonate transport system substrate-binding protein
MCALAFGVFLTATVSTSPLIISTIPFDVPEAESSVFQTFGRHLSKELGRPVKFKSGGTYKSVVRKLLNKKVDIAFLGAASYIRARDRGQVRVVVRTIRRRKLVYHGIIFVAKGSGIQSLKDLKGKRFAFVDKESTAGYHYPRRLFLNAGVMPMKDMETIFAGSHHAVMHKVSMGEVDGGASFEGAENMLVDSEKVVPIARTPAIITDPVVVRPGLSDKMVKKIRLAFLKASTHAEVKECLAYANIDGFVPAVDADYREFSDYIER